MKEYLINLAATNPVLAVLLYILLQILQTVVAPLPGAVVGPVGGFLFGWAGIIWTTLGAGIGSIIVFYISRKLGKRIILKFVKDEEFNKFEKLLSGKAEIVYFLLFLIPGLPDDTVCYVAGLSKIPIPRLVVSFMLGRLPAIIVANYLGMGAQEGDIVKVGVAAAISALAVGIVMLKKDYILDKVKNSKI